MIGRIILGLIIAAIGFMLVWKTVWMVNNFGRIPWFEQHLHTLGGSYMAYKTFGIIAIIIGLLTVAGLQDQAATAILSPLFGRFFNE